MIDYVQHVLEIEEVKKEADKLMMAKVTKYENEILRLKSLMHGQLIDLKNAEEMRLKLVKELKEVKDDNKKLAKQIEDIRVDQGGWR
jgi:translation initiation factor 2B subunit (eIF-2B alpha/beta/delta family)